MAAQRLSLGDLVLVWGSLVAFYAYGAAPWWIGVLLFAVGLSANLAAAVRRERKTRRVREILARLGVSR